jgi:phosphoribosylformylglycinamidine synthase
MIISCPCIHIDRVAHTEDYAEAVGLNACLSVPIVRRQVNGEAVLDGQTTVLRDVWEATSFQLEYRQCNPECVAQEQQGLASRTGPKWRLTYAPEVRKMIKMNDISFEGGSCGTHRGR